MTLIVRGLVSTPLDNSPRIIHRYPPLSLSVHPALRNFTQPPPRIQASNCRKPRDKLATRGRIERPINRRLADHLERHNSTPCYVYRLAIDRQDIDLPSSRLRISWERISFQSFLYILKRMNQSFEEKNGRIFGFEKELRNLLRSHIICSFSSPVN